MDSVSKFLFLAIDVAFKHPQNPQNILRENQEDVVVQRDILFDADTPDMRLDTYFIPKRQGKYPVIFEIHGGGFSAGDKKYRTALCTWYAKQTGAFVVNVNYGLGRKYFYPTPMIHLLKAFNWVIDNADYYHLDTTRICASGDSAGAYYSSALAVYPDSEEMQEACKIKMKGRLYGAVLNCGIFDMKLAMNQKFPFHIVDEVCKDFSNITPEYFDTYRYKNAISPIEHVTKNFPKSCIVYSNQDVFCGGQGQALIKKLNKLGVYEVHYGSVKFLDNHTFSLTWLTQASQEANRLIIDFLNNLFSGKI